MSKLLSAALKGSTGGLVGRMQTFLYNEECACYTDKKLRNRIVQQECELIAEFYAQRIAQFSKSGARDRDSGKYHPSSIGACQRAVMFKLFGGTKNRPYDAASVAKGQSIFGNGDYVHLRLQILLKRMGILECYEMELDYPPWNMEGHSDGVVVPDGERTVLEIKSINDRGYGELSKYGAKEDHIKQVQCYMHMAKLKNAIILYENKDKQMWMEFKVPYDPAHAAKIEKYVKTLDALRKSRTLPDREGDSPQSDACRWCDFSQMCYSQHKVDEFVKKMKGAKDEGSSKTTPKAGTTAAPAATARRVVRIKCGAKRPAHPVNAGIRGFLQVR